LELALKNLATLQGQPVQVSSVVLRLEHTQGVSVGPEEDNLTEVAIRSDEPLGAPTEPYTGDKEATLFAGSKGASSLFFEIEDPIPFTLLGVVLRANYGTY